MLGSRITDRPLVVTFCWGLVWQQWRLFLIVAACLGCFALLRLPTPILMMYVIDGVNAGTLSTARLGAAGTALFMVLVVTLGARVAYGYSLNTFRARILYSLQRRLFRHVLRLPLAFHGAKQHSYLVSRINEDVYQVQGLVAGSLLGLISDALTLLVGVLFLFTVHWRLACLAVSVLPALVVLYARVRTALRADFKESQERSALLNGLLGEYLSAIFSVKTSRLERQAGRRHFGQLAALLRKRLVITRKNLFYESVISVITGGIPIVILVYGCLEISRGRLSVGEFIAFSALLGYLYRPAEGLIIAALSVQSSVAAIERITELLDLKREDVIADPTGEAPRQHGRAFGPLVQVKDVWVRYDGRAEWALRGVNLRICSGDVIALVGPSGAGKSTFVNLLPRLLAPTRGSLAFAGRDLRAFDLSDLRERIFLVSQESRIFKSSVVDNIRCGRPGASMEQVVAAAQNSGAHEFILGLSAGYHTQLGECGTTLSAGQRQRIALARAFLEPPSVLLLDEATAFIDEEAEAVILDRLRMLAPPAAIVIVSHRPSILRIATRRVYVSRGIVRETGGLPAVPDAVGGNVPALRAATRMNGIRRQEAR